MLHLHNLIFFFGINNEPCSFTKSTEHDPRPVLTGFGITRLFSLLLLHEAILSVLVVAERHPSLMSVEAEAGLQLLNSL